MSTGSSGSPKLDGRSQDGIPDIRQLLGRSSDGRQVRADQSLSTAPPSEPGPSALPVEEEQPSLVSFLSARKHDIRRGQMSNQNRQVRSNLSESSLAGMQPAAPGAAAVSAGPIAAVASAVPAASAAPATSTPAPSAPSISAPSEPPAHAERPIGPSPLEAQLRSVLLTNSWASNTAAPSAGGTPPLPSLPPLPPLSQGGVPRAAPAAGLHPTQSGEPESLADVVSMDAVAPSGSPSRRPAGHVDPPGPTKRAVPAANPAAPSTRFPTLPAHLDTVNIPARASPLSADPFYANIKPRVYPSGSGASAPAPPTPAPHPATYNSLPSSGAAGLVTLSPARPGVQLTRSASPHTPLIAPPAGAARGITGAPAPAADAAILGSLIAHWDSEAREAVSNVIPTYQKNLLDTMLVFEARVHSDRALFRSLLLSTTAPEADTPESGDGLLGAVNLAVERLSSLLSRVEVEHLRISSTAADLVSKMSLAQDLLPETGTGYHESSFNGGASAGAHVSSLARLARVDALLDEADNEQDRSSRAFRDHGWLFLSWILRALAYGIWATERTIFYAVRAMRPTPGGASTTARTSGASAGFGSAGPQPTSLLSEFLTSPSTPVTSGTAGLADGLGFVSPRSFGYDLPADPAGPGESPASSSPEATPEKGSRHSRAATPLPAGESPFDLLPEPASLGLAQGDGSHVSLGGGVRSAGGSPSPAGPTTPTPVGAAGRILNRRRRLSSVSMASRSSLDSPDTMSPLHARLASEEEEDAQLNPTGMSSLSRSYSLYASPLFGGTSPAAGSPAGSGYSPMMHGQGSHLAGAFSSSLSVLSPSTVGGTRSGSPAGVEYLSPLGSSRAAALHSSYMRRASSLSTGLSTLLSGSSPGLEAAVAGISGPSGLSPVSMGGSGTHSPSVGAFALGGAAGSPSLGSGGSSSESTPLLEGVLLRRQTAQARQSSSLRSPLTLVSEYDGGDVDSD
ncbi:hypothetical protein H696_00899 [Fonticula alba]|uniref:Uncharacterized protein n=1 Tax=Fonticula alba TaxID=691883 RepID=A0A058ZG39_FONAL|nr:hypothetical protein H696_00899 [Fonticula alba]KCV73360.1 hypothetical protein H696_00899 [Fonticula alba]|eukprot:XP_009493061.1 hypothetical protein H696_00899 [Fonticula alba]